MRPKKQIKRKKTNRKRVQKKESFVLEYGNIHPSKMRLLLLIILNVFILTGIAVAHYVNLNKVPETRIVYAERYKNPQLKKEIDKLVEGYPIERMTPYIADQDPKTAAFLVSIAKKESAWGKHKPVLNGQDCYNYWGFRLKSDKMGSGGHTCFDSPKEAVDTVAQRIDELVKEEKIDSPKEMIVWKCGYDCQNKPKDAGEQKWIKDVEYYYDELIN